MDFGTLLQTAKENGYGKNQSRCYSTKFAPPKKEEKKAKSLSANIQKFLARKEAEEKKKSLEAKKIREDLLALRSQDRKATRRVNVMLKRTKSANQSVIEDAVDNDNTAVTLAGPSQPDEDDYGYVSQEAAAFYNKMMEKYNKMPEDPKFPTAKKKASSNLSSTKDRVRAALEREKEEALLPHRRKRKHKEDGDTVPNESQNDDDQEPIDEPPPAKIKPKVAAPPPMNFSELLKLASQKQHEPIVIEVKPKEDEGPLLTKKQKREIEKERLRREAKLQNSKMPPPERPAPHNTEHKVASKSSMGQQNDGRLKKIPMNLPAKSEGYRNNSEKIQKTNIQNHAPKLKNALVSPQSAKPRDGSTSIAKVSSSDSHMSKPRNGDMNSFKNSKVPSRPEVPSRPVVPSRPEAPSRPVVPSRPEAPSRPVVPSRPEVPSNKPKPDPSRGKQPYDAPRKNQTPYPLPSKRSEPPRSMEKKGFPPKATSGASIPQSSSKPINKSISSGNGQTSRPISKSITSGNNRTARPMSKNITNMDSQRRDLKPNGSSKDLDRSKPLSSSNVRSKESMNVQPKRFPPDDVRPKQFPPKDLKPKQFPPPDVRRREFPPKDVKRKPQIGNKRRILDDDDEYDSEMDDFIDDGPEEEEDYSKYIKDIFGYDKSKYRGVDEDDIDNMESTFAQQMKEDVRSTKLGIMEDLEDIAREKEEKRRKAIMKKRSKL